MAEHEQAQRDAVPDEELERQEGEPLPDREVMTILPIELQPVPRVIPDAPDFESQ
jgi:hypothetical protein